MDNDTKQTTPKTEIVNCTLCAGTGRANPGLGPQRTADNRCTRCNGGGSYRRPVR